MEQSTYRATKISTIVIVFLVFLGVINGEYLRPKFGNIYILNHLLGAMPNFIGSYILYIIFFNFVVNRDVQIKKINLYMYLNGVLVFSILTFEEYYPFFFGSKTFDVLDIIANVIGIIFAFLTIKYFLYK